MKHQTITLVKFKALSRDLGLSMYQTVGLLESLWIFAQIQARDGDLSGYTPDEIAGWIEYSGDADTLFNALVNRGWIDKTGVDQYMIHDWDQHKPNWLKGVDSRHKKDQPSTKLGTEPSSTPSKAPSTEPGTEPAVKPPNLTQPNLTQPKRKRRAAARRPAFKKPMIDQVVEYCRERQNNVDPEVWYNHYETVGWVVGRNKLPMVDWKAAVRTWEKPRGDHNGTRQTSRTKSVTDKLDKIAKDSIEDASSETLGSGTVQKNAGPVSPQVDLCH